MAKISKWKKFRLLLWKNWVLQLSHKIQLLVEIFLPVLFILLLVLIRAITGPKQVDKTIFTRMDIDSLQLFNESMAKTSRTDIPNFCLYYSPYNRELDAVMKEAAESLNMTHSSSKNGAQLEKDMVFNNGFAAVQFSESLEGISKLPEKLEFVLRFPSEMRTKSRKRTLIWFTKWLYYILDRMGSRNMDDNDGGIPSGYVREGFVPVQHAVSMAYIKVKKSNDKVLPKVYMQRNPYPPFIYDSLVFGLGIFLSMIVVLSFTYPCTCITKYVTYEKEKQLKEVMKLMGLDNWMHWLAWFVKSFTVLTISAILIIIVIKINWISDVAVLTHSDGTVLFVFFIVYIIETICFCFMMSTFFTKASTASTVAGQIWFISYIPFLFIARKYDSLSLGHKLGWCLVQNTALPLGVRVITVYEAEGEGIHWYNLFSPVNVDDDLSLGYVMVMMLVASFIYLLICLYVEQIFPGDFGIPRKYYFPFTRSFWCGEKNYADNVSETEYSHSPAAFESEPPDKAIILQIRNLTKQYGKNVVVKSLSANMYEDEITVLLGHNGAGKTTTISMLTGMVPPTSGTAIINDCDIRTNIDCARMSMSICPQHNVLFEDMSVSNHLRFFSRLKGLNRREVDNEIEKYLKILHLGKKAHFRAGTLSGGMKRKLSVCCALCGNTKVVLCDEPSSGMDPSARRQLWDLLQKEKIGRTILLTTHFMDEADVLGDRIAIMRNGELKCFGSSFFLKKHYGSGYKLICVKMDGCQPERVTAVLRKYIPGIQPKSDAGSELSYDLPDNYSAKFETMFRELEERSEELKLSGYGVGIPSMQDVFMKVGADTEDEDTQKEADERLGGGAATNDADSESMKLDAAVTDNTPMLHGLKLYVNQWRAMMLKRILYTYRNKLLLFVQNTLGPLFVLFTICIARSMGDYEAQPAMKISLNQYDSAVTVLDRSNLTDGSESYQIASKYEELAKSFGPQYTFESTGTKNFSDYILELGESIQVRINSRYLAAATIEENYIIAWLNNLPLHTAPLTLNMVHNAIARQMIGNNAEIGVTNWPLPYAPQTLVSRQETTLNLASQMAANICFCMSFITTIYIIPLIKERESRAKLLQFVSGVRVWIFWFSQFIWDFATFTVTSFIIILAILCFQEPSYKQFDELGRIFLLLLIFGCAALPFTYVLSHLFTEPATGFSRVVILNLFTGMAVFLTVAFMSNDVLDTSEVGDTIASIFRIFPHFSLAMSLHKVTVNRALRIACESVDGLPPILVCELVPTCCGFRDYFVWEHPGVLPEIVYMVSASIILFALIMFFQYGLHKTPVSWITWIPPKLLKRKVPPLTDVDDDVEKERQRILNMSKDEIATKNLVLDHVCKFYSFKFLAVNQVSLCVEKRECFGLLGVNGAGKTSLFKMMTGDLRISQGKAYMQGMSLKTEMNKIYERIGYCPQFDALLEDLTGREILKVFLLLRGVETRNVNRVSEQMARLFGFIKHIDKMAKTFSGGNKRKLNTAIAVTGTPSIIYLDEPTSGMDPGARRQLWNVVCRIRDSGKSIVLTSHSMDECEALCTRLAIMVNGQLKCMGSTQHLKNKFSKNLVLKIKLHRNTDMQKQYFDESQNESSKASTPVPYSSSSKTILQRSVESFKNADASNEHLASTPIPYMGSFADVEQVQSSGHITDDKQENDMPTNDKPTNDKPTNDKPTNDKPTNDMHTYEKRTGGTLTQEDINRVKEFVQTKFPQSFLKEEYQGILTFHIPLSGIRWSEIFGVIERNRYDLNIEDYFIGQTSLEEIFLEFAEHQEKHIP